MPVLLYLKVCAKSGGFKLLGIVSVVALMLSFAVSAFSHDTGQRLFLDFFFSLFRVALSITVLMWITELLEKPIRSKTLMQSLAYPISRGYFLIQLFLAVMLAVFVSVVVISLIVFLISYGVWGGVPELAQVSLYPLLWVGLWFDVAVLASFAVLIAVVSETPFMVLVTGVLFYVSAHTIVPVLELLMVASYIDGREVFQNLLGVFRYLVPDLSALDVRNHVFYPVALSAKAFLSASVIGVFYCVLCFIVAVWRFNKREIN